MDFEGLLGNCWRLLETIGDRDAEIKKGREKHTQPIAARGGVSVSTGYCICYDLAVTVDHSERGTKSGDKC